MHSLYGSFVQVANHISKLPSLVGCTVTHMGQLSIWLIVQLLTWDDVWMTWDPGLHGSGELAQAACF